MQCLVQNLRYSLRRLYKNPGFGGHLRGDGLLRGPTLA
jgi:hypothetical protein